MCLDIYPDTVDSILFSEGKFGNKYVCAQRQDEVESRCVSEKSSQYCNFLNFLFFLYS